MLAGSLFSPFSKSIYWPGAINQKKSNMYITLYIPSLLKSYRSFVWETFELKLKSLLTEDFPLPSLSNLNDIIDAKRHWFSNMINGVWTRGRFSVKSIVWFLLDWKPLVSICICGMRKSIRWVTKSFQYRMNFALKLTLELYMFWSMRFVFILLKDSWMKILIMLLQTCLIELIFFFVKDFLKKWVSNHIDNRFSFWCWFLLVRSSSYLTFQLS